MRHIFAIAISLFLLPAAAAARPIAEDPAHVARLLCRADVILPTPQKVEYSEKCWDVFPGKVAIVISPGASAPAVYHSELVQRLIPLSRQAAPVTIMPAYAQVPDDALVIALGTRKDGDFIKQRVRRWKLAPPADYPGREGYAIRCREERGRKVVLCVGWDRRGVHHAAQSVIQLFGKRDGKVIFRPAKVDDWPTVAWRGAKVTGIPTAAKPDYVDDLAAATAWLYAAKFNAVHVSYPKGGGAGWREPTEAYRRIVVESARFAAAHDMHTLQFVNPYVGSRGEHSPKSKIVLSNPEDLDALERTLRLSADNGGDGAMICLDDYCPIPFPPYVFTNEDDQARFKNVAEGAAFLASEMARRLRKTYPGFEIVVCPPWFCTTMVNMMGEDKAQAEEFGKRLPSDMAIVWTGPGVRSLKVTEADFDTWSRLNGREKPFFWDNTFYQRAKYGGTFVLFDEFETKYPRDLAERVEGFHFNNGNYDEVAMCGLLDLSNFLWNPAAFDPKQSRQACMEMFCGKDAVDDVLAFRETFYRLFLVVSPREKDLSKHLAAIGEDQKKALKALTPKLRAQLDDVEKRCWNDRVNSRLRELVEFYESIVPKTAGGSVK